MQDILTMLVRGRTLTVDQTIQVFQQIMAGGLPNVQVGAMLAMMQLRGATSDELTGAAKVMRQKMLKVAVPPGLTVVDNCGTGGDHAGTFNVSTAAAIVADGAGRRDNIVVAKHGNQAVTSKSGSSQVFKALGVKLRVGGETLTRCLKEAGLCFCYAPAHHPAMKNVMPVRLELGIPTIFNLLGPLTNPAGAQRQIVGVYADALTEPLAGVLKNLGAQHAMVVHGTFRDGTGLDELVTHGTNRISHLQGGQIRTYTLNPEAIGVEPGELDQIKVESPEVSANLIESVLAGEKGPAREIVRLNAAAVLVVADLAMDFHDALILADQSIDSGAAKGVLAKLVELTKADPTPQT